MNRQLTRFIARFLVTVTCVLMLAQFSPAFGQRPAPAPVPAPQTAPAPANDNVPLRVPANDNIRPVAEPVNGAVAGVALRGVTPWLVEGTAIFGFSLGGTVTFYQWTGRTNISWGDLYALIASGEYRPFASPASQTAPQSAPRAQLARDYPCAFSTENYPGKIDADSPQTPQEVAEFDWLRKVTQGLTRENGYAGLASDAETRRLNAAYGGNSAWEVHYSPGFHNPATNRMVKLRFFRRQYTVIDFEYKFVTECGKREEELPVLVIQAAKMPHIAAHILTAWVQGYPQVLTYLGPNNPQRDINRRNACGKFKKLEPNGSCDEYPFASTVEGGTGASIMEVPLPEQGTQAGTLGNFYRYTLKEGAGSKFRVVVQ